MKNKEIEIKLKYKDKEEIKRILKKIGAKFKEEYILQDTYFSFQGDMANAISFLRLREKGNEKELTFKGKKEEENHVWKRTEINTKIYDLNKISEIILNLGLNKIKENKSKREIFILGNLEIVFIDFIKPVKMSIIELERNEKDIERTMKQINHVVERIGEEAFKGFD